VSLLIDGPLRRIRQCRHGLMGYFVHDQYVGKSLDIYGEFSESEVSLFREIVKPGDIVLEAGANIGSHTLFLARAVGQAGRVLAFEPQQRVYQMLCANLALNELFNVDPLLCGLGARADIMQVPRYVLDQEINVGGVALCEGLSRPGYEPVAIRTVDSFQLSRLDFLKVDVEGMEHDVLDGARETIWRCRPIMYLENDREEKSEALLELVDELGYRAWWHLALMYNPNNVAGNSDNIFSELVSVNIFCVPKELPVQINNFAPVASAKDWFTRDGIPRSAAY